MLTGLLGHHIGYSASPAMQNAAFAAAGLADWTYELFDVSSEELPAAVAALRRPDHAGANVTIPHKLAVMPLLDDSDPLAVEVGAVNFIRRDGDLLVGDNTDVAGIRAALEEVGWEGGRAVVLGRGGSARAALIALKGSETEMVGRDRWAERGRLSREADLVVNCTPLGRQGESVLDRADLPRKGVVDLVYAEGGTPLTAVARAEGLAVADGWTVLLHQGAASFEAWTGLKAPLEAMRAALKA